MLIGFLDAGRNQFHKLLLNNERENAKRDSNKKIIIDFAINDERITTILLNGSRANPNVQPDKYN
ncbi:MAG: aminoglycoside 6-adenylyltransferase [Parafilimonas sp.]